MSERRERRRERRDSYDEDRSRHSESHRERRKHRSRSPRERHHRLKESPPRRRLPAVDQDLSPPRTHPSVDTRGLVRKEVDDDLSPPRTQSRRRAGNDDGDLSPPRSRPHIKREPDGDLSPPRARPHIKREPDGDLSPPRARPQAKRGAVDADGDLSPPRAHPPGRGGSRGQHRDDRDESDREFRPRREVRGRGGGEWRGRGRGEWRGGGGGGRDRRPPREGEDGERRGRHSDELDASRPKDRFGGGTASTEEGAASNSEPAAGPDFAPSGKLAAETNTYKGVVINYSEPVEARIPKTRWRLYGFKGEETLPTLYVHRQSAYLVGRDRRVCDLPVDHPSCSKQHAVLQYRLVEYDKKDGSTGKRVRPYLIDLGSTNGCYINNQRIEPARYYELKEQDMIKFGFSSREYVILHENSKTDDPEEEKQASP